MAYSVTDAAAAVLKLLEKDQVCIDGAEKKSLSEHGSAHICGFRCKVVNVLTLSTCRALVSTSWFSPKNPDYSKPRMKKGLNNPGIDYQLIPTTEKLFAVHYLDLRQYALFLERDRDHWFSQSYWGMQVDEASNSFVWTGGNSIAFPLLRITRCSIFIERDRNIREAMQRP